MQKKGDNSVLFLQDADGNPRYLRRYLEGYRLEINGKLQSCLGPSAQTCTLTKCKAGKTYHVVLVAMTCTEDRHRERREKVSNILPC